MAHLSGEDQTAVCALFGDQVTFDDVTMWRASRRSFGKEYRSWRMMPEAEKIATAESAAALVEAAMDILEYASDKIADLHGRRKANDRITRALQVTRRAIAKD